MKDVDLSRIFPLEFYLRRLPGPIAGLLLICFLLGAWALGAFIDGVTL